ncbi:uncharacterized protein LOC121982536 [Zingiber officinale]|uniref:ENT domain-containing protein n=1 Tax=Zingiber officinale TaxID=94328 RepID=A0A8J5GT08_ZINOF|nr:uncharacterized protein LOC121982536 [Zingiber officinale]XP_042391616.1 uncharacterized protein LOC121982536 [Zingiber officinale]XP_042391617.1 uncharacterized protein LOC121982536 [Zingiber officinale]XP_042391618.1 uncharacterized protein LOC121982536 [Zingiber officinale]KAG6509290.1 hypothetical protein ZIOFF_034683 [Zingiber officinale]
MKFKQGDEVEVLRRNKETYASWFPSIILSVLVNKYSVTYKLFVSPQGKPIVETVDVKDVRPCPPIVPYNQDWHVGDVAEVLDTHSWKVARIVKIVKNKYVVAKIFGSIQLKRFSIYDAARVSQAWQNNNWFDKVESERHYGCGFMSSSAKQSVKLEDGTHEAALMTQRLDKKHPEDFKEQQSGRKMFWGISTQTALKGDLKIICISSSDHEPRGTSRKRKDSLEADDCDLLNRRTWEPEFSKARRKIKTQIRDDKMLPDETDECSVASCSGNGTPESYLWQMRRHSRNASRKSMHIEYSSPHEDRRKHQSISEDKLASNIHKLELNAYRSTLQALYASGPLSWEQESLLTNLRLSLNISNEEHSVQLKQLLSV